MIKITNIETYGWEAAIRGMRNSHNSWSKSDSSTDGCQNAPNCYKSKSYNIGPNDLSLMLKLAKAGSDHAKYRRMVTVTMDVLAPLYWHKQMDQFKVGTTTNSTSTMHTITDKEFTIDDFSHEHLANRSIRRLLLTIEEMNFWCDIFLNGGQVENMDGTIRVFEPKCKDAWWNIIQLLPSSYNQLRTVHLNYEVLSHIYHSRKDHRLTEWQDFCQMIERLPYSEIITLKEAENG